MRILLTGSHGFIGSHFRQKSGFKDIISWDLKVGKDIFDLKRKDLRGLDAVVHLAARISVEESWEKPEKYLRTNTLGTLHLAKLAKDTGVKRFIFSSSAAAYGSPMTPYGASKLSAEKFLESLSENLEVLILRFFNVYGKGQSSEYAGVITRFINQAKRGEKLTIYGDGSSIRDFIYVDDVVKGIKKAIETRDPAYFAKPLDLGTGRGASVKKLARLVSRLAGEPLRVSFEPARREIKRSRARPSKLFGKNFMKLDEGLTKGFFNR